MSFMRHAFWLAEKFGGFAMVLAVLASSSVCFAASDQSQMTAAQTSSDAPHQATTPAKSTDALALDEIIVTGLASGTLLKQDASFAISTLDAEQIHEFAPKTVADLFSATPGIWVEASGGDTGANVFVRGFAQSSGAQFVTIELNGMPIFPPSSVGFIENSALFRLDESIQRVEALRGGPSPVLGVGQAGATFNFIQKKGGPEAEGLVKATFTDFGTERIDAYYSGPISDSVFYSFGGFYRTSPGYRDPQYQGDRGGQGEFQLTKVLGDTGEVTLFGRKTADNNTWYLPIPLTLGADGRTPKAFPGFSAGHGTYEGNDTRLATLEISPGSPPGTMKVDSSDGRGVDLTLLGATLKHDLAAGWHLALGAMYTTGTSHTKGLVGNSPLGTLGDFINSTIAAANSDPSVTAAAGGPATGIAPGSLQFAGSGAAVTNLQLPVLTVGWWSIDESFDSFSVDARVSKELFSGNDLTLGTFLSSVRFNDLWYLGSNMLLTATDNGQRINFALNNGVQATRAGFVGAPFFDRNLSADSHSIAGFLQDAWKLTDAWTADAGVRVEHYTVNGTQEGVSFGQDLDNNPLTLYDNGAASLNGSYSPMSYRKTATSWTSGVNWAVSKSFGVFGRINSGLRFPSFDDVANGQVQTETIRQYELGAKVQLPSVQVFATAFNNTFTNIPYFQLINGQSVLSSAGSKANGVELETAIYPLSHLELSFQGTYQNGHYTSGPNDSLKLFRQPDFEARFAPAYTYALGSNLKGRVFASAWYVGHRFSDAANQQPLQPFVQYDAGVSMNVGSVWELQLSCDNLTNVIGLTERDPRTLGSGVTDGAFLGRPIFGRSFTLSAEYKFQ
jgi:iron complex outermembrane receptor protein